MNIFVQSQPNFIKMSLTFCSLSRHFRKESLIFLSLCVCISMTHSIDTHMKMSIIPIMGKRSLLGISWAVMSYFSVFLIHPVSQSEMEISEPIPAKIAQELFSPLSLIRVLSVMPIYCYKPLVEV